MVDNASKRESLRVAVLMGGSSPEREVSLASGIAVAAALEEAGHQVRGIDPAEVDLVDVDWRQFDVSFIALHGGAGEDGRVQQLLESLGVAYTGSGPAASRLAMSKLASKRRFDACRVPTPSYVSLEASETINQMLARVERLGYPIVVKPDAQGSSLGVNIAGDDDEFQRAVTECLFYGPSMLAEQFVAGRELTVAVLGRRALPLLEIVSAESVFSYDAKYHDTATEYVFDTGLAAAKVRQIERTAVAAAKALGTRGLARVDLRLDLQGRPWVLEVNTVPGMTERSLATRAAAHARLDMPTLCDSLLRECLAREYSQ